MFIVGHTISRWNVQSFVYSLLMLAGVEVFFLGLIFFLIDTQPRVVWLTTILISCFAYLFTKLTVAVVGVFSVNARRESPRAVLSVRKEKRKCELIVRRRELLLWTAYNQYTSGDLKTSESA